MLRINERANARTRDSGSNRCAGLLLAALAATSVMLLPHSARAAPRVDVSTSDPDAGAGRDWSPAPVRSEDRILTGLIRAGLERSPTFRGLYVSIAARRGIVHVMWDWKLPRGLVGAVPYRITRTPDGTSYLRVLLAPCTAEDVLIATIAHELRHVVEMLDGALEPAPFQSVMETEDAIQTGLTVRRELLAAPVTAGAAHTRVLASSAELRPLPAARTSLR